MTEPSNMIGRLSEKYSDNPGIISLLNIVPYWSVADALLQRRADEIKAERLQVFFDELAQGKHELTDELIQSNDFLHAYFCTLRAVINCRQQEKIQNFARLLDSTLDPTLQVSEDEHEELLAILDEITLREFKVLRDLRNRELAIPIKKGENALRRARQFWNDFRVATVETHDIPNDSFNAFMARLERTGLYLRITGGYLDYSGDIGSTTPLFARLITLLNQKSNTGT